MTQSTPRMAWPFPSREDDPWFDGFESFSEGVDASGYAHREDRSIIWSGGGSVSWDLASQTFAWTSPIVIHSPIGGRLISIAAGSVTAWTEGDVVYVVLTRQPLENLTASLVKASTLPSTDNAMALGVRIGDALYFRTGISLGDGDSSFGIAPVPGGTALEIEDEGSSVDSDVATIDFTGAGVTATQTAPGSVQVSIPGGAADKYTSKFIVGNALAGDTTAECHYLDPGDGSGIAAALLAAQAAGSPYPDVWIRNGQYNLGTSGVGMLTIPAGVKVRGSGRESVLIVTADGSAAVNPHAFSLGADAELSDLKVLATTPAAVPTTTTPAIVTAQGHALIERVEVDFDGYWSAIGSPTYAGTFAAFEGLGAAAGQRARFVECHAVRVPYDPTLSVIPDGFDVVGDVVSRCYVEGGGNIGISATDTSIIAKCIIENDVTNAFTAIELSSGSRSKVIGNEILGLFSGGANSKGIRVNGADSTTVQGNSLEATAGSAGADAIEIVQSDDCSVVGNVGTGFVDAISLDSLSDDNVVGFNNFAGSAYADAGVGNDLAHNK